MNKDNSKNFVMQLFFLQDNTIRLKVNEAEPLKPRYEVPDTIVKELHSARYVFICGRFEFNSKLFVN